MLRRLNRLIRRFADDRRGISAVEFALVAPILIMLYLGLAELTLGMMASRRTAHLAATIGDLAAQSESLTMANISDLWDIGDNMLSPMTGGTNLKIILSSVTMGTDSKGNPQAKIDWSEAHNASKHNPGDPVPSITTSQISAGESLIMTEVEYDYTSPIGHFLPGMTKFTNIYYHHPRSGSEVTCSDCT